MIPFIGGSDKLDDRKADAQQTVNLFVVKHEVPGGKNAAYLDSIPGLTEFSPAYPHGFLLLESGGYILLQSGGRIRLE